MVIYLQCPFRRIHFFSIKSHLVIQNTFLLPLKMVLFQLTKVERVLFLLCMFLRHFGRVTIPVTWSSLSLSLTLVFHKSFLLHKFSLQFLSVLYQVDSARVIIHLQLTGEILSNNFPCISTFPCVRLKTSSMAYIRVIPNIVL